MKLGSKNTKYGIVEWRQYYILLLGVYYVFVSWRLVEWSHSYGNLEASLLFWTSSNRIRYVASVK